MYLKSELFLIFRESQTFSPRKVCAICVLFLISNRGLITRRVDSFACALSKKGHLCLRVVLCTYFCVENCFGLVDLCYRLLVMQMPFDGKGYPEPCAVGQIFWNYSGSWVVPDLAARARLPVRRLALHAPLIASHLASSPRRVGY
jgi:hypothetical protein